VLNSILSEAFRFPFLYVCLFEWCLQYVVKMGTSIDGLSPPGRLDVLCCINSVISVYTTDRQTDRQNAMRNDAVYGEERIIKFVFSV